MTPDLAFSLAKIVGSVLLLAGVLVGVGMLGRRLKLHPELARKIIHVSLGLYCLTFPWVFTEAWEVAVVCLLAGGVFVIARARPSLGEGLHGVKRFSYGELLFAVSVAVLFYLKDGHYVLALNGTQSEPQLVLYVLPLLILTMCDAASALVGVNYGRMQFTVEEGIKSVEGVITFILTAWIAALIALLLFTDLGRGEVIVLALIIAMFGALFEAASWRGLDNLFIPIGLYFILANLLPRGTGELLVATGAFAAASAPLIWLGAKLGMTRHMVASAMSLLFCMAVFAGLLAVVTPVAVFAAYYFVWREGGRRIVPHDALNMIVAVTAVALTVFVLSALFSVNTIFAYNLSLACLATGILVWFSRLSLPWLAGAIVVILPVSLVRALAEPAPVSAVLTFAAASAVLMLIAAVLFRLMRDRWPAAPWIKLAVISLVIGLAGLPFSPHAAGLPGISG